MEDYQYILKIAKRLGIDIGNKTIEEIYIDIVTEISFIKNRDMYQLQLGEYKDSIIKLLIKSLNVTESD